ncbi:unnamed protein product, partial [Symbiodinium sp. KB8]
ESWATSFINHFKLETLDDFIYMIDRVKWQEEIKALLDEVPPLKDSRLILARFRGAFESGLKAIEMSQSPAAKVDDYDDPLPEQQQAQLQRDWQQAYGIAIEPHLEPADSLRARIFREFRRKSLTVLEIKKIKSVLSSTSPASQEQVTLQGSVTLHFAKETLQSINTIIDYYFGLRVLANAWAMAGNYLVTDPDSVERRMIKLDDALNYADGCLRDTVQFGGGSLAWLQKNDTLTRGLMASKVHRGWSAGQSLREALHETHLEWRSPGSKAQTVATPNKDDRKRKVTDKGEVQVPESSQSGTTACRVVRMEATQDRDTASQSSRDDTTARQALPSPLPHNLFAQDAAQELAAARPVTWRGRGDLLQVPWAKAAKGRWLVIDLWSGISGVCVTLLSLGLHFHCIAAEWDESAVQCARHCFPSVVHVPLVEHITVETIVPYLKRRQIRGIIIGGGSPCQPNSALNRSGKGLQDSRARQPQHLSKLLQAMRQHPLCRDLEIIGFLENVASAEVATVRQYSEWLGGLPIEVDGACCGWARRRRLFWLVGGAGSPDPSKHPAPADWAWQEGVSVHGPSLTYIGTKPIPARIFWEQGFKPLVQPDAVMKGTGQPMHTFTREFYHPEDHIREVSPSAAERFLQDGKRFPPAAYEEHSLLWRKEEWRTPTPEERSQVMGIPPACTEAMQGTAAVRTQKRNSAIGNGFHIPSLLVATVGIPAQPTDHVAMRVRDTIWEPGYLENFPGATTVEPLSHTPVASFYGVATRSRGTLAERGPYTY